MFSQKIRPVVRAEQVSMTQRKTHETFRETKELIYVMMAQSNKILYEIKIANKLVAVKKAHK